ARGAIEDQKHPATHFPLRRSNETNMRAEGGRSRLMGISEAAPRRTRSDKGGGLRLSDQGELPSRVSTGSDRRRISRGDLVSLRHAYRPGTHHSRTPD